MNYRDLVFLKVVENMSFSKAAAELYISQPAVTKHIKELESQLQTKLFERKANRIFLTPTGEITYHHFKKIRKNYQELIFELGRYQKSFQGTLRLGASSTLTNYVLPPVLAAFYKKYPKIRVSVLNGNSTWIEKQLLNNELDLALVENSTSRQNIRYFDWIDDEIIAVTHSKSLYANQKIVGIKDLTTIPLILREKGSGTLQVIEAALKKKKIKQDDLNVILHLGSTEAIKNFLYNFDGIAFLSQKSVQKEMRERTFLSLHIPDLSIHRKFRILSEFGQNTSTAELFRDFLLSYNK